MCAASVHECSTAHSVWDLLDLSGSWGLFCEFCQDFHERVGEGWFVGFGKLRCCGALAARGHRPMLCPLAEMDVAGVACEVTVKATHMSSRDRTLVMLCVCITYVVYMTACHFLVIQRHCPCPGMQERGFQEEKASLLRAAFVSCDLKFCFSPQRNAKFGICMSLRYCMSSR